MSIQPDDFDELQEWLDSIASRQWSDSELKTFDDPPSADFATQVDLAAGEFFRATWRRRLADAQGDCGYVARQMRKAGVPLDLALAVLLAPRPQRAATGESGDPFGPDGDDHASSPAHIGAVRTMRRERAHAA